MYAKTDNPYRFKYLVTGITGPGIPCVYLPPEPPDEEVLFKKEQKFVRPVPPNYLKEWMDEFVYETENTRKQQEKNPEKNIPDYIHPHQEELNKWEEQEFERCTNGIWFWNKGVKTYLTNDHYKYLTSWELYFGFPDYRETDKETWYWVKYWEEDPSSFGGTFNTIRREGKSAKMGFWLMNRTSTSFSHFAGMQGEDNMKIKDFYDEMVMNPFYRLPYYHQPQYDTNTLQKKGILFTEPPKKNKKRKVGKRVVLGSKIDYRTSEPNKYDQAMLNSYVMEEAGKTIVCSVKDRWKFVKPCLKKGIYIRGKAFIGTTVEYMDVSGKGGKAYQKLCLESDYDIRQKNGQTISGLYASLMPGDCALEGFFDEHGIPDRKAAMKWILDERDAVKDNPKDYSDLVRKYPTNWNEVFYISADKCEFNVTILQDRKAELQMNPPPIRRVNLSWQDGKRFTKVVMSDDPANGWCKMAWIPKDKELELLNNVGVRIENGKQKYFPKNNSVFSAGTDPIDYGVKVDNMSAEGTDSRRSRPVMSVKRKYDPNIDGFLSQELLERRAKEKYPYKTNKRILMMDQRPGEPNIYFERCLMICWLLGVPMMCESQKPGVINYFKEHGCEDFQLNKYVPSAQMKPSDFVDGTPASTMMNQELTGLLASLIEYFGHVEPFVEFVEDYLLFDPTDTKKFDYAMCAGWNEVAEKVKPKTIEAPQHKITEYFRRFRRDGSVIK
jgi:hypothetical protein